MGHSGRECGRKVMRWDTAGRRVTRRVTRWVTRWDTVNEETTWRE